MENKREYLFGLIFTIILFLIMDKVAPNVSLLLRVSSILGLLLIGRLVFNRFFIDEDNK